MMLRKRLLAAGAAAALTLALLPGGMVSGADTAVTLASIKFTPATVTVPVGATVVWTNQDSTIHTVTANNGAFASDVLKVGQTFRFTFNQPGTFDYICTIHPEMKGTIVVTGAAPAAPGAAAAAAPPAISGAERDIPGGRFFTETNAGAGPDAGFAVVDDAAGRLWSEFLRLGAVSGVGYPVSRRFTLDGFLVQDFQKGLLQWRPDVGLAQFANVMDKLHDAGKDDWLKAVKQIPAPADTSGEAGKSFDQIRAQRLAALDSSAPLKSAYTAPPNWMDLYGLPVTPPTDMGNVVVVRGQRAALQLWKQDVPWAKAGQVTVANGGDILKESGLLPAAATSPGDAGSITATGPSAAPVPAPAPPPPPAPPAAPPPPAPPPPPYRRSY